MLFDIWSNALQDIAPDRLDAACDRLMKTWRFPKLPLPGDVRAQLDSADAKGLELEAAQEWENALRVASQCWHPDIGLYQNAPSLSPACWHALKAAGGLSHLFNCGRGDLQWARKRFIADYTLTHETGKVEHLLGAGEAKRVLHQLAAGPAPERKRIAPASDTTADPPQREEVRAVLLRVSEKPKTQEPSDEELSARWREQKERARQWAIEHGLELQPGICEAGQGCAE